MPVRYRPRCWKNTGERQSLTFRSSLLHFRSFSLVLKCVREKEWTGAKRNRVSVLAPPRAAPTARDGKDGTGTSEVALVAEGGGEHALGDHTAAVRAHQLALRIVRVFHQLSGAAVGAAASARHLTTCPAPGKLSDPQQQPPCESGN